MHNERVLITVDLDPAAVIVKFARISLALTERLGGSRFLADPAPVDVFITDVRTANVIVWRQVLGRLRPNIDDVAIIKTWQGGQVVAPIPGSNIAHLSIADVDPGDINLIVNFNDVFKVVQAFQGEPYPFGPADADGNCP